jgi:para-nitrobenzyl esterase
LPDHQHLETGGQGQQAACVRLHPWRRLWRGGANVPIYNGAALAKRGIVVVTIQYRVGVFGFLAHPALTAESPLHSSGNYGLLDQIEALKWVKANIARFGAMPPTSPLRGNRPGRHRCHI